MPADAPATSGEWFDREAGPVVRPYTMTQGRVAPVAAGFDLLAFVVATAPDPAVAPASQPEHRAIIEASWEPVSVAELAARLDLGVGVVRVLLLDLRTMGLISLYEPPVASLPPDVDVLKAVVNGLRAL